ncbi:RagB/SusD family nutrient uptake outer membrane protein [Chryseobacterium sp. 09-1422]|uniref:RagB/SusD family nutrient uptake outer membrane protein n=1 Tax=Chryseobacterium kimseyorum TaxID=2984028 RepID=A0ABT3I0M7_9FLAO|nr:RagB/SusD family nutrient uptake outer membrane protein [Chryseobacterium kimseyorum]MCW3169563.1 RagB/SusD family nutrient uptake outer membrane protein [Chryseobacterium kimseyorum]
MKKTIVLLSILSLTFINNSCSEDFLDTTPTQQIALEDLLNEYNNDAGAESFVTAIYSKYLDWNISSFAWIGMSSIVTDDADKGSSPGDSGSDKDVLDALTFSSTSPSFQDVWEGHYQAINRSNQALKYLPLLDKADASLRSRLEGEAKFLRAFSYFILVRSYGDVPLVDKVFENTEADRTMVFTRKSKAEIYAFIESDLQSAIATLPQKNAYSGTNIGRASKGAAHALLAKVALYQKKWQQVIDHCDQVVGYSLTPNFQDIYKVSGENNAESVFEIQGKGGPSQPGIQQYSQVQGARGAGGWGWGFNTPSQNLVDAFNAAGDTERRDATIIIKPVTLYDGRLVPATVENNYYNYKAYSSAFTGDDDSDANIRYLRYSEVLLMKAEAMNELGQTANAATFLNQVRNRAGLANTTAVSQADMRTAIYKERRLELAMEHDRWFDIVRTGQAQAAMAADGKTFKVGTHEVFPVPNKFILEAKGLASQNLGY